MNIFASDPSPVLSAQALDNIRLSKMILETVQIFAAVAARYDSDQVPIAKDGKPYGVSHANHPCTRWAGDTRNNAKWLLDHLFAMRDERVFRGYGTHTSLENKHSLNLIKILNLVSGDVPPGDLSSFPNCTDYKHISDVHQAYRLQLIDKWNNDKRQPGWGRRGRPSWY